MVIEIQKPDTPWYDKFRNSKEFKDSTEFVEGYNKALDDIDTVFGLKKLPDEEYRCGTTHGSRQIHEVCKKWKLTFK